MVCAAPRQSRAGWCPTARQASPKSCCGTRPRSGPSLLSISSGCRREKRHRVFSDLRGKVNQRNRTEGPAEWTLNQSRIFGKLRASRTELPGSSGTRGGSRYKKEDRALNYRQCHGDYRGQEHYYTARETQPIRSGESSALHSPALELACRFAKAAVTTSSHPPCLGSECQPPERRFRFLFRHM